ncbi:MAG: secondary thiamine-phosphate synthase enzyme YjbQ [Candidatus Omnitrophica bacterium]|nr:secondary thiamine-phosphate synthase enzyme YjbQ [Candidatus Omnitrophota bacterium]MBU4346227.1 secondary thiamine-phosphate synthase enzyme YjbQ [Candidatus Omnitrophota bacterium]MBU4473388.1 secondary thiamine-phosphate synthase enzyme YjbQ [Candidatus Omnitrophota bacterium]MCG2706971.1 secondary thiamine-phosphate synthase enzyme YjbQ [Candidatus Omnitrophota bacterium]
MKIINERISCKTKGNPDLIDITKELVDTLSSVRLKKGNLTVFVIGSTAAITTFEYEPGLIKDVQDFYDKLIPVHKHYAHDQTWGDANGFSHLRAALQGPSLTIPFEGGRLILGTWQQVVLAEFDNRPRQRQIVVQIIGE